MALDSLQVEAWREDVEHYRTTAEKYRREFKVAKTARDKLRLKHLAEMFESKADRMEEFIEGRIRADEMKSEFAEMTDDFRKDYERRSGPMGRELTQAEVDRLSDADFLEYRTSGLGKPVTRSIGDQLGKAVAEIRAAIGAAKEEEELAHQWRAIQAQQFRPLISISNRRRGY